MNSKAEGQLCFLSFSVVLWSAHPLISESADNCEDE